jgi:hypothetical protein
MLARKFCGAFTGSGFTHCASLHDLRTEGDNMRTLYRVRILRKKNCGGEVRDARRISNRGTVVTRAGGNNS